jgi:hypothetical protein
MYVILRYNLVFISRERKSITVENAVFTPTVNILTKLNQWKQREFMFCNLAKAFDKILQGELFCFGIHGVNAQ